jgi:hypothetical protein
VQILPECYTEYTGRNKKRNLGFSSPILAHNPAQKTSSDYLQPHIGTLADKLLIYSSRNQQRLPTAPKRRGSKQL